MKKSAQALLQSPLQIHLLAIDLEPTPYKIDLWNGFTSSKQFQVEVLYTHTKDRSVDAGHDYQELPKAHFFSRTLNSNGILGWWQTLFSTVQFLREHPCDVVFIAGYIDIGPLVAIGYCSLLNKPFLVHSDIFNLSNPAAPLSLLKKIIRNALRHWIFKRALAILVCGKLGLQSALDAGCARDKVIDFPYVVDLQRILTDEPEKVPRVVLEDIAASKEESAKEGHTIFYFSGRMITRKGLANLLAAFAQLRAPLKNGPWVLWIAGAGPLLGELKQQAQELGLSEHCRFLGFVQMRLHSYLLRNANVVVVPSLQDGWGIVVDEAMQVGKMVIASSGVGSSWDRIEHQETGLVFSKGDVRALGLCLSVALEEPQRMLELGSAAGQIAKDYGPKRNGAQLASFLLQQTQ